MKPAFMGAISKSEWQPPSALTRLTPAIHKPALFGTSSPFLTSQIQHFSANVTPQDVFIRFGKEEDKKAESPQNDEDSAEQPVKEQGQTLKKQLPQKSEPKAVIPGTGGCFTTPFRFVQRKLGLGPKDQASKEEEQKNVYKESKVGELIDPFIQKLPPEVNFALAKLFKYVIPIVLGTITLPAGIAIPGLGFFLPLFLADQAGNIGSKLEHVANQNKDKLEQGHLAEAVSAFGFIEGLGNQKNVEALRKQGSNAFTDKIDDILGGLSKRFNIELPMLGKLLSPKIVRFINLSAFEFIGINLMVANSATPWEAMKNVGWYAGLPWIGRKMEKLGSTSRLSGGKGLGRLLGGIARPFVKLFNILGTALRAIPILVAGFRVISGTLKHKPPEKKVDEAKKNDKPAAPEDSGKPHSTEGDKGKGLDDKPKEDPKDKKK